MLFWLYQDGFFWIKDTMSGIKKIAHNISQMKIFETPVSNVPMPTIPTVTDQTAGWQTYTNNEYGFAFKYPKDYSVNTSPVSGLNVGLMTLSFKENITYPIWFYVGKSDDIKIKDKTTPSPTGTTNCEHIRRKYKWTRLAKHRYGKRTS